MKILELYLENFRCFDKATFEFSENFNLLIGDNATGKTVILDALAIAAGSFFLGIDGIPPHNITKDEIRRITKIEGEIPTVEIVLPVVISCAAFVENMKINPYSEEEVSVQVWWSRELKKIDGKLLII